jgi:hypothetical protein
MAVEALEHMGEVIAGLDFAAVPPEELGECLVALARLGAQIEAVTLACTSRFDKAGGWADDGALGLGPWLRSRIGVSATGAYRQVRTARALEAAPVLREAFRAGELSTAKMRLLAALALGDRAELFARDEAVLVAEAKTATAEAAAQMVRYWRALADDELGRPDQTAEALEANQSLRVSDTFEGTVVADLQLAPIEGAIWRDELDRLTEELWQASTEQERADIGVARRRAAAQVEMAKRSAEWRADTTGRVVPLFVGVVGLDVLEGRTGRLCQTDRGGRITPQAVHDWLDGADFAPLITGPGGAVLHFGRTRRVATRKQRQAVTIRDGNCTFTGCDRPAGYADTHHLVPWDHGGGTDIDNLALLCHRHHHHAVHQAGFTPDRDEQGRLRWRRPDGTPIPEPLRDWHPATNPPLEPSNRDGASPPDSGATYCRDHDIAGAGGSGDRADLDPAAPPVADRDAPGDTESDAVFDAPPQLDGRERAPVDPAGLTPESDAAQLAGKAGRASGDCTDARGASNTTPHADGGGDPSDEHREAPSDVSAGADCAADGDEATDADTVTSSPTCCGSDARGGSRDLRTAGLDPTGGAPDDAGEPPRHGTTGATEPRRPPNAGVTGTPTPSTYDDRPP